MANTSVKLYLKASKRRADGTAPVYIRITANRRSSLVSTGVYVEPKFWNADRGRVRSSHDIADALNDRLQRKLNEVRAAAIDAPSARRAKAAVDGPKGSLSAYLDRYVSALRAKGDRAFWEARKFEVLAGKVRDALGFDLSWGELDRDALAAFERHLRDVCGNSGNTTRKELSRLRRVVREAVRDGEIAAGDDPFLVFRMPKNEPVDRRRLTLEEVEAIAALGPADGLVPGSFDEVTRDAFVLAFYASGLRFGDVCRLKASDIRDGRAEYRALKTGRPMSTPLPPPALAIVSRYSETADERGGFLLPLLKPGEDADGVRLRRRINSRNSQANTALKRIGTRAGIDVSGLSFHVSRHSFADHARRASGDVYSISKALGHSDLKVTAGYLSSFDRDALDDLNASIW